MAKSSMFRFQPIWFSWARFLIVLSAMFGLLFSLFQGWSGYGLFIFGRTICQLFLAHQNNQQIRKLIRHKIILALEKKTGKKCTQKFQQKLLNLPEYSQFRRQIYREFPKLQHQEIWNPIIWQVFFDLNFSKLDNFPPVYIEIPIYHPESLTEVEETLTTLRFQSYPAIREILLCFNDPTNLEMLQKLRALVKKLKEADHRLDILSIQVASKRTAMYQGFQRHQVFFETALKKWGSPLSNIGTNQILQKLMALSSQNRMQLNPNLNAISVNIDADTQVDPDAIALGVMLLLLDTETTAITSNVEIRNSKLNFLTKLTAARYKSANVIERAAQSSLKTVRCMSGPFMMFWTRNLLSLSPRGQPIAHEWVTEKFLGVKVEPGDDRSWTVRHNEQGFGVRFHPDILVTTDCPVSWPRWKKQQLRWMRSGNRNFFISLPFLCKLPIYIIFDDLYLFFFPVLLLAIVITIGWRIEIVATHESWLNALKMALPYFSVVIFLHFFKALHLAISQKKMSYLWLCLYFFVYVRFLIWLRILSLITITQSEWTGRTSADFSADQASLKGATNVN